MQLTLVVLFCIGMIGDAFTSFLGILGSTGAQIGNYNDAGNYALALFGTCVITGLNIYTMDIFERKEKIMFLIWLPAILVDFITSLVGSFGFIKPEANQLLAYFIVFLITIFITASPGMARYILKNPIY